MSHLFNIRFFFTDTFAEKRKEKWIPEIATMFLITFTKG